MKKLLQKLFPSLFNKKPAFALARWSKRGLFSLLFFFVFQFCYGQSAGVSISITSGTNPSCQSASLTFTAVPANGGTAPTFQWKVNGANVGINSATYTTTTLTNGQIISCVMTSNLAGVINNPATSNSITQAITTSIVPSVSISTSSPSSVCPDGNIIYFYATSVSGGSSPTFVWKVNGNIIQGTLINGATCGTWFSTSGTKVITCEMTSNAACASPNPVISNSITINVKETQPSISISSSSTSVCQGSPATFTANVANLGNTWQYKWKVNGIVSGNNSSSFTTNSLTNGQTISCDIETYSSCPVDASPDGTIGGTNLSGILGEPYPTTKNSDKQEFLIHASELISSGLSAGMINSISFYLSGTVGNPSVLTNYKIRMASTSVTDIPSFSFIPASFTDVYGPLNYAPIVNGKNTHSFSTPFYWDGVSNIIVDICYQSFTQGTVSYQAYQNFQTGYNSATETTVSNSFTPCIETAAGSGYHQRPLMTFSELPLKTASSNSILMSVTTTLTPTISISASATKICNGSSVTFTASPLNGGTTPSYQWKVNGVNAGTNSNTFASASLYNGDAVSCVLTSSLTCANPTAVSSNVIIITVDAPLINSNSVVIVPFGAQNLCPGTNVQLNVSGSIGSTIQWKLNNNSISGATTSFYTAHAPGQYNCELTNTCGSYLSPSFYYIEISLPTATITSPSTSLCAGNNIVLSANTGTGLSYQWKLNATVISGATAATYSATAAGSYTCVVSNSCGSTLSNSILLTQTTVTPSVSITAIGATIICSGTSATFTASPLNGGTSPSFQWKVNGVNTGTNSASYTTSSLTNGDVISCDLTSNAACASPVTVTSNLIGMIVSPAIAAAGTISGLTSFCAWLPMQFGVAAIAGATTYNWSVPIGATITSGQGTNQITVVFPNTFGSGQIMVSGSNGTCSGVSSSLAISVLATPSIPFTLDAEGCSGTQIGLVGNPIGGSWSVPNPYSGPSTTFYYTVTNYTTGCSASSTLAGGLANTITVNPLPVVTASNVSGCAGTAIALSGTPVGGTWSIANPYTGNSTTYTHTYTDANGCSNTSAAANVTVNPLPTASISSASTVICNGSSITLSANTGTGLSYQWKLNTVAISGATAATYAATAAGSYSCIVSNACGSVTSNAITITVGSLPTATITASGATTFCQGGSVTLTAATGNGYTYQWKLNGSSVSGATASSYIATQGGNWKCTITSTCGSATSNIIAVTVLSPIASITASGFTTFCGGGSVVLSAAAAAGQTYAWKKDGTSISGATASSYTATTTGNYKCVVTSSCGSSTSNVISVAAGLPAKPSKITGATKVCANTSYSYSVAAVSTATSYQWTVPSGASITSGIGTTAITVLYGAVAGNISCAAINVCGTGVAKSIVTSINCIAAREHYNVEETLTQETRIIVFPNPSDNGIFNIAFQTSDVTKLSVFDLLGKKVFEDSNVNSSSDYNLNLTTLTKGVYVLKVEGITRNEIIRIQK